MSKQINEYEGHSAGPGTVFPQQLQSTCRHFLSKQKLLETSKDGKTFNIQCTFCNIVQTVMIE
jgi:hypothetical protein